MIIDLSRPRSEYFEQPSIADILRGHISKDGNIQVSDLREANIIVGTIEEDLDGLLKDDYHKDTADVLDKLDELREDQLLILPPDYRIERGQARQAR